MPELPEIYWRARECDEALRGRTIVGAHLVQPKCLNLSPIEFANQIVGQRIQGASYRGKWIVLPLDTHSWLLNLGMGGELLLHAPGEPLPEKLQASFDLDDGARLSLHFWWFGYIHLAATPEAHPMVGALGADPLSPDFTPEALRQIISGRRTRTKSLLLDQSVIAGIGNFYAHDVLYRARLHPLRPANTLGQNEIEALWRGIRETMQMAIDLGGAKFESNLYGQGGRLGAEQLLIGYKEGQPCPSCGATIIKIQTGSTTGFICPSCQVL